jgi:hypothetical protein
VTRAGLIAVFQESAIFMSLRATYLRTVATPMTWGYRGKFLFSLPLPDHSKVCVGWPLGDTCSLSPPVLREKCGSECYLELFFFSSMVSSYLVHHGYCSTATAFARMTETPIQEEQASIKNRQSKVNFSLLMPFTCPWLCSSFLVSLSRVQPHHICTILETNLLAPVPAPILHSR